MDETCILKVDSFRIFCMMILLEILHASDEVSGPIFVKKFRIYIHTNFYMVFICFKWKNLFSMSFMCLSMFIYNVPCLV